MESKIKALNVELTESQKRFNQEELRIVQNMKRATTWLHQLSEEVLLPNQKITYQFSLCNNGKSVSNFALIGTQSSFDVYDHHSRRFLNVIIDSNRKDGPVLLSVIDPATWKMFCSVIKFEELNVDQ